MAHAASEREPEEVAAFKLASEYTLKFHLADTAAPILFRAGRLYARALLRLYNPLEMTSFLSIVEDVTGAECHLSEGNRMSIEPCPECTGFPREYEPICHGVRDALHETLGAFGEEVERMEGTECAAVTGELVDRCEFRFELREL